MNLQLPKYGSVLFLPSRSKYLLSYYITNTLRVFLLYEHLRRHFKYVFCIKCVHYIHAVKQILQGVVEDNV